jgi:hypothetical protein
MRSLRYTGPAVLDVSGYQPEVGQQDVSVFPYLAPVSYLPSSIATNVGNRVNRSIDPGWYDFHPEVTIEEDADDVLEITQHPVEQGAAITDHAYKRPAEVRMRLGWSDKATNMSSNQLYGNILDLQSSRRPFTIQTGKRAYNNMLVADLRQHTDAKFEYSLMIEITFRQILLVNTSTTKSTSASMQSTSLGNAPANTYTAGQGASVQPIASSISDEVASGLI